MVTWVTRRGIVLTYVLRSFLDPASPMILSNIQTDISHPNFPFFWKIIEYIIFFINFLF